MLAVIISVALIDKSCQEAHVNGPISDDMSLTSLVWDFRQGNSQPWQAKLT